MTLNGLFDTNLYNITAAPGVTAAPGDTTTITHTHTNKIIC